MCATIADLVVGGWLIDHLIKRGYDETPVRKTVLVLGMLFGLAVFGTTFTTEPVWAILWISIRAERVGGGAGGLVDTVLDRASWRHRHDRGDLNFLNNMMGVVDASQSCARRGPARGAGHR
jgi:hypothetical protein